jgi:hypothetical protein
LEFATPRLRLSIRHLNARFGSLILSRSDPPFASEVGSPLVLQGKSGSAGSRRTWKSRRRS